MLTKSLFARTCIQQGMRFTCCPSVHKNRRGLEPQTYTLCQGRMLWTRLFSFWGSQQKPSDWTKAVSDAEKLVGYPTSFMSLRCLLSDELSNVALHMRKLVGTKHPLLKTARKYLYDGKHSLQTRGLLILLLSKAAGAGPNTHNQRRVETMVSGIYPRQRSLAEIVEMIHTAHLIHTGVVNLDQVLPEDGALSDMEFGNKMAVLSGDFLLANASTALAALENTKVVELISGAIGDLMEAEFSIMRDQRGNPTLPDTGFTIPDWQWLVYKGMGALIAKSCRAALLLSGHNEEMQQHAYNFGKNMAYAHQLHDEILPFTRPQLEQTTSFSVLSAPVVLHLNNNPHSPASQHIRDKGCSDPNTLVKLLRDTQVISECRQLCEEYGRQAKSALNHFPPSDATTALHNMVHAATVL